MQFTFSLKEDRILKQIQNNTKLVALSLAFPEEQFINNPFQTPNGFARCLLLEKYFYSHNDLVIIKKVHSQSVNNYIKYALKGILARCLLMILHLFLDIIDNLFQKKVREQSMICFWRIRRFLLYRNIYSGFWNSISYKSIRGLIATHLGLNSGIVNIFGKKVGKFK